MHNHLYALQRSLRYAFVAHTTLPYRLLLKRVNPRFRLYALVPDIIGAEFLDW